MNATEFAQALKQLARSIVNYMHDIGVPVDPSRVARRALIIHGERAAKLPRAERAQLTAELELFVRALEGKGLDA